MTLPAPATVPPMMLPGDKSIEIASLVLPVIGTIPVASVPTSSLRSRSAWWVSRSRRREDIDARFKFPAMTFRSVAVIPPIVLARAPVKSSTPAW